MTDAERFLEGMEMNNEAQSRAGLLRPVAVAVLILVAAWLLWAILRGWV